MTKPKVNARTVDVVFFRGDWHIQWPDGTVTVRITAEDAMKDIKAVSEKIAKKSDAIEAVVINWFNTPEGFKVPK